MTQLANLKFSTLLDENLDDAFPDVDPGVRPYGQRVLVQLKNGARTTKGGIIVTQDTVQTENDTTQVAKVRAVGVLAFKNRETMVPWPEGDWAKVGDFVRIPLHLGSQATWTVQHKDYRITFAIVDDLQLHGEQPDPFYIRSFL